MEKEYARALIESMTMTSTMTFVIQMIRSWKDKPWVVLKDFLTQDVVEQDVLLIEVIPLHTFIHYFTFSSQLYYTIGRHYNLHMSHDIILCSVRF